MAEQTPTTPPTPPPKPSPSVPPPDPNAIAPEDIARAKQLAVQYHKGTEMLGTAERQWHYACVQFYEAEREGEAFDRELRQKYGLRENDRFDFRAGRIVRATMTEVEKAKREK